jgi:hypothetical protein
MKKIIPFILFLIVLILLPARAQTTANPQVGIGAWTGSGSSSSGSVKVIYASAAGVPAIASIAAPQSGPDGTAALQAVLNTNASSGVALRVIIDEPILAGNLAINSNTTIEGLGSFAGTPANPTILAPSGLWQRSITNGTDTCILTNTHRISPYQGGTITDHDIYIRHLHLDGQRRYPSNPGAPTPQTNANGQICSPIQIYGCNGGAIEDVFNYDPIAFGIHEANIFNFDYHNIGVCDPNFLANPTISPTGKACIQFCGPWDNITIDGLYGTAGDDFLAFNMVDANLSQTIVSGATGPGIYGNFNTVYYGSGGSTIVKNVRPYRCFNVLRVLNGSDGRNNGVNPTFLSSLIVDNVVGTTVIGPLLLQPGANVVISGNPITGTGGGITFLDISNWQVGSTPGVTPDYTNFPGGLLLTATTQARFSHFRFNGLNFNTLIHQVSLLGSVNMLTLDDFQIIEGSGEASSPNPMLLINGNFTVNTLIAKDCQWLRASTSSGAAMFSMTGSTVNTFKIEGIAAAYFNNILSYTGGTLTNLDSFGLTHLNAGGNPSINVGSGKTLARLRASCSDTVQLQAGSGTVTSKKTDSTEDS